MRFFHVLQEQNINFKQNSFVLLLYVKKSHVKATGIIHNIISRRFCARRLLPAIIIHKQEQFCIIFYYCNLFATFFKKFALKQRKKSKFYV